MAAAQADALAQILQALDRELAIYRRLGEQLESQYAVAARMDSEAMLAISQTISADLAQLDAHNQRRPPRLTEVVALLCRDAGAPAHARIDPRSQAELQARCRALRDLALQCRALTARNGKLLAEQFEAMQQVLHGETHTYAPG